MCLIHFSDVTGQLGRDGNITVKTVRGMEGVNIIIQQPFEQTVILWVELRV